MRSVRVLAFVLSLWTLAAGADESSRRLENLETLAHVWTRIYLFHPLVVVDGLHWEQLLADAIPAVEAARTDEELMAAIEATLLSKLGDDAIRVYRKNASAAPPLTPTATIESRRLANGIGLIAIRDPNDTDDPKFLDKFAEAYRSLGAIQTLVVDLRWPDVQTGRYTDPSVLLRFFVEQPITMGNELRRQHHGWTERPDRSNVYRQDWVVQAGNRLAPITQRRREDYRFSETKMDALPLVTVPATFVVNNYSHLLLAPGLEALQRDQKHAVVWEKRGGSAHPSLANAPLKIGSEYELHIPDSILISPSGGHGFRPDVTTTSALQDAELARIASEQLTPKSRPAGVSICR